MENMFELLKKKLGKIAQSLSKKFEEKEEKTFVKRIKERIERIAVKKLSEKELDSILEEMETELIEADVAVEVVERIKENLKKELVGKGVKRGKEKEEVLAALKKSMSEILSLPEINLLEEVEKKKPYVILFLGANGSGKTTMIAKIAKWLKDSGRSCVLAAADTFRAASIEQLEEHAKKIGVKVIKHKYGADPAAVVFDAVKHAKSRGIDFVLADTAGRIHTDVNLMNELKKIIRVNKPDLKILVVDSLIGNDAVAQARFFGEIGVDATVFTKIDVNKKGGAILSVTNELRKPILFLGNGQDLSDLVEFRPTEFINNLFDK